MQSMDEAYQFVQYFSVYNPEFPVLRWAIRSKDGRIFYGTGGFYKINLQHRRAEIGGELLKQHWSKGVATEAMSGIVNYGFNVLRLNRIMAMVAPDNKAANALINKGFFKREGCLRQWEKWGDRWVDLNIYSLLQEEWRKIK
ncbi:putative N-acetyltransferase YoaA [Pullulanibacillus camelliae]|uniref:Putative N-acetyltransferase YoaA n=2 Tax=Pullulanibacillus camelliae TaxID=1707096 RepID=A0A8J2YL11_9BACL|nr:putative N-acetyltransferase YoaA [Pullulanibacillus camelliae]